jgi:hypothetical protein
MKLAHARKVPCTEFAEVPGIAGFTARDLPASRNKNKRKKV